MESGKSCVASVESSILPREEQLPCPNEFPFPFEPYPIQVDFMRNLFATIEARKIGIFESPTGTVRISWLLILHVGFLIVLIVLLLCILGKIFEHYLRLFDMVE